jgi:hypothetical protein
MIQRPQLSQLLLNELQDWLETNINRVPRDSLTYKAIYYALNQWGLLIGYCDDGKLNISNGLAENAIRPFAWDAATGCLVILPEAQKPVQLTGGLYAFTNRQHNKIECLYGEENGFVLHHKSLSEQGIIWPRHCGELLFPTVSK